MRIDWSGEFAIHGSEVFVCPKVADFGFARQTNVGQ